MSRTKGPDEYRIKDFTPDSKLKADGSNFFAWKDLQETILYANCWYEYVDGTFIQPGPDDREAYRKWHQVDNLAKGQLSFNMDSTLYNELRVGTRSCADLWKKISDRFGQENVLIQNKMSLQLRNKRIQVGEAFRDHIFTL